MTPEQRVVIKVNEPALVSDIIPSDILSWLMCLTDNDKDVITAEERNSGPTKAATKLLNLLQRRPNSFEQLVCALRENCLQHLAKLLDPNNEGTI